MRLALSEEDVSLFIFVVMNGFRLKIFISLIKTDVLGTYLGQKTRIYAEILIKAVRI